MNLIINGEKVKLDKQMSIKELLIFKNVSMPDMVSVEYNGEILDKADYDRVIVQEDDSIEFLYFMGGGSIGL